MTHSIERVKYPDGTIVVRHVHDEGEWWRKWVVAPNEELAFLHTSSPHYSCPGMSFTRAPVRIQHPKKVVFIQSGGLDI